MNKIEKSKNAIDALNDFSYLQEHREKNRESNQKLRSENFIHKVTCLVYLCTCDINNEEYDQESSSEFLAKLEGIKVNQDNQDV